MSNEPFFVIGFQRSGTTLLRLMLNAHPDIAIPLDTAGLWARYELKLPAYGDLESELNRRRLVADILAEERIRLWKTPLTDDTVLRAWTGPGYAGVVRAFHESYAAAHGKSRWGSKDPGDMLRLDTLHRWFPTARFIHIIRDGRDACLSQLDQDFGFENLLECASAWREEVQWVRRMGAVLGNDQYFELRYEDLVADPEGNLRALADYLGVTFDIAMLHYHERVSDAVPDEKRHLWPLLAQPPQISNVGRWKTLLSHGKRICFEKRAASVLKDLGYDTLPGGAAGAYLEETKSMVLSAFKAMARRLRGAG